MKPEIWSAYISSENVFVFFNKTIVVWRWCYTSSHGRRDAPLLLPLVYECVYPEKVEGGGAAVLVPPVYQTKDDALDPGLRCSVGPAAH